MSTNGDTHHTASITTLTPRARQDFVQTDSVKAVADRKSVV